MRPPNLLLRLCLAGVVPALPAQPPAWQEISGGRAAPLAVPAGGQAGFTEMTPAQTGITFTNPLAEARYLTNQILLNGSGVAAGDVDGDGWCDLYFCALDGPNALYRNLGGWRFTNVTATAGVACADQASTGAALADVDGDADLDLLVNGLGRGTRLFLNDGRGVFREVTAESGLRGGTGAHSLALADVDGDGDLDLYVVNYRTTTFRDEPPKRYRVATANNRYELLSVDGRPLTDPDLAGRFTVDRAHGVLENGEADVLYLNDGRGRFAAVSWTDGTFLGEDGRPAGVPYDWGLSALFHDLNGDGAPDLYVCNDFQSPDRIWINDGRGHFRALSRLGLRQTSIFSMGVDVADVDRDGRFDLFVADMYSREHARRQVQLMERQPALVAPGDLESRPQYSRNTLFWNRGDGLFSEVAQLAGVEASDWTWCPVFLDVDLDGYEDLLTVTGHVRDAQNIDLARRIDALTRERKLSWREQLELRRLFEPLRTPNFAFRNRGDLTFAEVGRDWGFESRKVSQGIALADLDLDGDLDVAVNCLDDAPLLCRNDSPRPRVAVRLRGAGANTRGIGARITVRQPGLPAQSQEIISGGRYLSSDDAERVFAAVGGDTPLTIEVLWRGGARCVLTNVPANRRYEINEAEGKGAAKASTAVASGTETTRPLFEDASARLAHRHQDEPFDDFARQPLLPLRHSQLGPGVSWFDFDGDGWEDLLVGSGRGGALAAFRNDRQGGFTSVRGQPWLPAATNSDQTAVLGWSSVEGRRALLVGQANYETGPNHTPAVVQVNPSDGGVAGVVPGQTASTGPLALADLDGDGDLDLCVGGRIIAGRFAEPADSLLFRNNASRLMPDAANNRLLARAGLVSDALFTDLDGDGFPELALACHGGPLRVFRNARGALSEWNPPLTWPATSPSPLAPRPASLAALTGWWNSVAAGDFDGDGRLDLVAGNWGRNTKYQGHLSRPLHVFSGDLDGEGIWEVVEAYHAAELDKLVPWRDWGTLAGALPFLLERYRGFTEFSQAGVAEFLGARLAELRDDTIATLDSVLLLNRGDRLEAWPLPVEAQLAPVFGLAVADFDGDGREDVFLAQNFYGMPGLTSRHDAGLGVLLRGDGQGGWTATTPQASGIYVFGEGRGVAAGDFDHDGRADLVVGQNAHATRLFRNVAGRPGLRVRLVGPPGNPAAVGAVLRAARADGRPGPAREVRAGGGYWSQPAATQVLAPGEGVVGLRVTWPGGRREEVVVPAGAREIEINSGKQSGVPP